MKFFKARLLSKSGPLRFWACQDQHAYWSQDGHSALRTRALLLLLAPYIVIGSALCAHALAAPAVGWIHTISHEVSRADNAFQMPKRPLLGIVKMPA